MALWYVFLQRRAPVVIWISIVIYLFYDTYNTYNTGKRHRHLRHILGVGLCISRATATVLNISCALVLLPVCKKMNQLLYHALAKIWPRLFFFWLQKAKSWHMILACTIVLFAVIHSAAHFCNLWNFSRHYDETHKELNFARKGQNPMELLVTQPGLTGVSMLIITLLMTCSSMRRIRRSNYNLFRYTHQLFVVFMALLLIHPLSGVLKEELIDSSVKRGNFNNSNESNYRNTEAIFVPIKSQTWKWISLPLLCCSLDWLWRFCSRNQTNVLILQACELPGRAMSLVVSAPGSTFRVRLGQYVLIQCPSISRLEWHPFSVTQVPSDIKPFFNLLIRVKGDWTEALERMIYERILTTENPIERPIQLLVDGPYSSPLESMTSCEVALCVAAGVGVTPFISLLAALEENPRSRYPGRVHMIWIVRRECEISWIAELATRILLHLREANRPDRLHLELYVTNKTAQSNKTDIQCHTVTINSSGKPQHLVNTTSFRGYSDKTVLLTTPLPPREKKDLNVCCYEDVSNISPFGKTNKNDNEIVNQYPLLGCRVLYGRPRWGKVFAYWNHLYPGKDLPLYCCGPKKLTKCLRDHCQSTSLQMNTKINLIYEGFS